MAGALIALQPGLAWMPDRPVIGELLKTAATFAGIESSTVSHLERILSTIGGCVAIGCIFVISDWALDPFTSAVIIASMGSSAVLLFAVPHGPLSQPWPLIGGHLVSALIGVGCARWISSEVLAASLAVGLSIGAMYYLRCIHPPGGATALGAVVGSASTHELGFLFVLAPILLNVAIILAVAIAFNYLFPWRRYPLQLHRLATSRAAATRSAAVSDISHEDFVYALSEIDSFIDISEHDLLRIYDIATHRAHEKSFEADQLKIGACYSNGEYGPNWSVRMLVEASPHEDPDQQLVIYKTVAGQGRRSSGYSTRSDFLRWARHRVVLDEGNWKRSDQPP